jgi:hypothetical protein
LISFICRDAISDRLRRSHPEPTLARCSIMSDFPTSLRVPPETPAFERPRSVRSFQVESQRKVVEHCRRLLKAHDLAAEHRQRLTRLVEMAEAELQRLHA